MPAGNTHLLAFNRGMISALGLARIDLKRTGLSAETQTNWMPRVLGSMMLRPGLGHLVSTKDNAATNYIPFVAKTDDTALVEPTDGYIRVLVDDAVISRSSVTAAVANGAFSTDLASWTDSDDSGGTSDWKSGGYMSLVGNSDDAAIREQTVTVTETGTEHGLRVTVEQGVVTFMVGSASQTDDYVSKTDLRPGVYSFGFTPTGNFSITFKNRREAEALVDSVDVESSGDMEIPAPWGASDLDNLRWAQSIDVLFVACEGIEQRRIERRATRSWGVAKYQADDGPFRNENVTPLTITPSAINGNITLTASAALFRGGHVGGLFRVTSKGQVVTDSFTGVDQSSDPVRITGVDTNREFDISVTGTFVGTVKLQQSVGDVGAWTDVPGESYTTTESSTFDDTFDNQIIFYRLTCTAFTSGQMDITLTSPLGFIEGIVRVTKFTSDTSVDGEVLKALGGIAATNFWAEGVWSPYRGFPTSVALYNGRLWWAGKDFIVGSVSDAFASFDQSTEGAAGPIVRTIGEGPADVVNWMLPLFRLVLGTLGAELSVRSTTFDEPLTPANFQIKTPSTQGSAKIQPVRIDDGGVFVQASTTRVYELRFGVEINDYVSSDLTAIVPEIGEPGIVRVGIQRKPDTRIHFVRSDGKVAVLVLEKVENVICWVLVETDGNVEDVVVLPGAGATEDQVYYVVNRMVNGSTKRYLEKWALESEAIGGTINKVADSFITYSQSASSTISGLGHLEGESVVVWDNGKCLTDSDGDIATFTVSSGAITVTNGGSSYNATDGVVGLAYTADFKSSKLAEVLSKDMGTPLNQRKRVVHLGMVLANTHHKGITYGPDADNLDDLPLIENEATTAADTVWSSYDEEMFEFPGTYDSDSRVHIRAQAPRPATVLALSVGLEVHQKT